MTLSDVNNAALPNSGSHQTGLDWIVHFSLQILCGLAFGFWFSSNIQMSFPYFFWFFFNLRGN